MKDIYPCDKLFNKHIITFLHETAAECPAPAREIHLAVLACLAASGSVNLFEKYLEDIPKDELSAQEVCELLYQASAYVGQARIYDFFTCVNKVVKETPPLPFSFDKQERLNAGEVAQIAIFGEGMRGFANAGEGAEKMVHSRLVYNCFGDYYTRPAIDLRVRELITACILATLGDVRPQLISHLKANIAMGNTREYLKQIVLLLQPYNGYPRTLNALSAIDEA